MEKEKATELEQETPEAVDQAQGTTPTETPKGSEGNPDETKQATEYAKTKQQLDQERANRKRVQAALQEAQSEKEGLTEQVGQLQSQMTQLQKQLEQELSAKQMANLAKLDPDTTDVPELVKTAQAHAAELQDMRKQLAEAKDYIQSLKNKEQQDSESKARKSMEEEIFGACDDEFGAQYRNEAVKIADDWVDNAEVDAPRTAVQGLRLMRKAYAEAVKKHAKPEKPKAHVPTDTGLRGLSVTDIGDSEEFKPGSLDEVTADIAKKMKTGKWNRKAFASSS